MVIGDKPDSIFENKFSDRFTFSLIITEECWMVDCDVFGCPESNFVFHEHISLAVSQLRKKLSLLYGDVLSEP